MQRTSHRCPHCSQLLALSSDMWGLYYLCATCGWTCEDDAHIGATVRREPSSLSVGLIVEQHPSSTRLQRRL